MAAFFFDSSGLVKRYVRETGSMWVRSITDPAARNAIHIARITSVEVISAVSRRARTGIVSQSAASRLLADIQHDFAHQYRLSAITPRLLAHAIQLVQSHSLRGYDAVQLAAVLTVNARRRRQGLNAVTLVSADQELNAAAVVEGLTVEDPNNHP